MSFLNLQKSKSLALVASLLGLLNGCAAVTEIQTTVSEAIFGREDLNPPAELVEFKPTVNTQVVWSVQIGEAENYEFSPIVDAGSAYAASETGEIVKLDAVTGKQIWRINVGEKLSAGVGVGANLVLVGTPKGDVLAYDQSGKLLWKSHVSSEVLSTPKAAGDIVVVRCGDNKIFGLNVADGVRKWAYERATPSLSVRSAAGFTIQGDAVFAGFAGGKLVAMRLDDGKVGWETSVAQPKGATEIERIADITSPPVVDGPLVYAVAYQGRIAAIERATGKMVWNRDISSLSGISAADARIYVSHALGSAYALDYRSGKTYWRQGDLLNRKLTAPLPLGDVVALGDLQGYVHFLRREDGAFAGRQSTETSPVMPQMAEISSNTLLAQNRNGGLYAISVK